MTDQSAIDSTGVRVIEEVYVEGPGFLHPHHSIRCASKTDADAAARIIALDQQRAEKAEAERAEWKRIAIKRTNELDFAHRERNASEAQRDALATVLDDAVTEIRAWRSKHPQDSDGAISSSYVGLTLTRAKDALSYRESPAGHQKDQPE